MKINVEEAKDKADKFITETVQKIPEDETGKMFEVLAQFAIEQINGQKNDTMHQLAT